MAASLASSLSQRPRRLFAAGDGHRLLQEDPFGIAEAEAHEVAGGVAEGPVAAGRVLGADREETEQVGAFDLVFLEADALQTEEHLALAFALVDRLELFEGHF